MHIPSSRSKRRWTKRIRMRPIGFSKGPKNWHIFTWINNCFLVFSSKQGQDKLNSRVCHAIEFVRSIFAGVAAPLWAKKKGEGTHRVSLSRQPAGKAQGSGSRPFLLPACQRRLPLPQKLQNFWSRFSSDTPPSRVSLTRAQWKAKKTRCKHNRASSST